MPSAGSPPSGGSPDFEATALRFVFSWVILMPVSVIIAGKLLARVLRVGGQSEEFFGVNIPKLFRLHARNDEVVLGFTLFIITLLVTALSAGRAIYHLFVRDFGIDPGQFNSICVLSSFLDVALSGIVFVVLDKGSGVRSKAKSAAVERDNLITDLSEKGNERP